MDHNTHTARLLKACNISIEQFLSFVLTSRHLTSRQRNRFALISGALASHDSHIRLNIRGL